MFIELTIAALAFQDVPAKPCADGEHWDASEQKCVVDEASTLDAGSQAQNAANAGPSIGNAAIGFGAVAGAVAVGVAVSQSNDGSRSPR